LTSVSKEGNSIRMPRAFRLSVAIPVHNEEAVVPELVRRVCGVLDQLDGGPHEIVFVDDGSTDQTFELLEEAAQKDPRIMVISLSRNFGHQAALAAALDHVTGDAAMVMDGDLQDAPEVIPQFLELYNQGYDVVYAQRVRGNEPWPLRLCYFAFYRIMARLSDISLPLDSGDFGLMSHRVIDQLRRMPEHHRYLRGLRSWVGFRQTGLPIRREERHSGRSKYSLLSLIKLATDGIFAFSIVPIRAAALLGAVVMVISLLYVCYSLYAKLFLHISPQGFTALIVAFTFLFGMLLFFLGVIGEYVGRIYEEAKARPLYIVGRAAGTNKGKAGAPLAETSDSQPEREREFRS
jgi:glycosyltransferase involved in cell wall biosynthesis